MTAGPISPNSAASASVSTCSFSGALNSGYWMRRNSSGASGASLGNWTPGQKVGYSSPGSQVLSRQKVNET